VDEARRNENFPVASRLIRPSLRPHVLAFYAFVRTADDIADAPDLDPATKLARLGALERGLTGDGSGDDPPVAAVLRQSLAATGLGPEHALHMLQAFRRDASQATTRSWSDLLAYCRYSAAPAGRYLLALHGEGREALAASDALCAALQILNHLQDCGADYRRLGRVYLPSDWLRQAGASVDMLAAPRTAAPLRAVLDRTLQGVAKLLATAEPLPRLIGDRGLRREAAIIYAIAKALARKLARRDPLRSRVRLTRLDVAWRAGLAYLRAGISR
jgi:squalene synthase HpnC